MVKISNLRCRVRIASEPEARKDLSLPAKPNLRYEMPLPIAPQPRLDAATDGPEEEKDEGIDVSGALHRADPRKVADRVYELMQRELSDTRFRAGTRKR